MQYQCERFGLPDAEFRCLVLFGEERYLTAKGIAFKMNVVKSRVSKIVEGLLKKKLIQRNCGVYVSNSLISSMLNFLRMTTRKTSENYLIFLNFRPKPSSFCHTI